MKILIPVHNIHKEIPILTTPSNHIIPIKLRNAEIRLNDVTMQSFIWSLAFASNSMLWYFFASLCVYMNSEALVAIVTRQTITSHHEKTYPHRIYKEFYRAFQ